ncbi:M56 family metallopeptidase [Alteromonas sp. P256]|uniref:M56 family metallopeptidase n=1 Tax=Alteromonas sp. P256 TaxID=3117399 RepID=UPI002FE19AF8
MTEWLIAQQGALSIALGLMLIAERFTAKMGALFTYKLWTIVPAILLLNNLPTNSILVTRYSISQYTVNTTPTVATQHVNVLFYLWALGAGAIIIITLFHYLSVNSSLKKVSINRDVVYYSLQARSPILFGFINPKIVLPLNFERMFCEAQQQMIIEHESVHKHHMDHLWNGFTFVLITLFWFNPLVWIALKAFRTNQELACDYKVLSNKSDKETLIYAKALVQCAEQSPQTLSLYPTFGEKSTMKKRLMLMKEKFPQSRLAAFAAVALSVLLMANTAAANMPPSPKNHAEGNGHVPNEPKVNEASPIAHVSPTYPEDAAKTNTEGYVVLQFDITETGATDNITVVKSSPEGVFDKSASSALKQWQYKPRVQNGQALRQTGLLVQLDYKLSSDDAD